MPKTPERSVLPFADMEVDQLQKLIPNEVEAAVISHPTRSIVLSALQDAQIVHFACHGCSAPDPSQSRLLLVDWKTQPLTVSDLASLNLPSPQFAFLSACHTANMKDRRLSDEYINLTSAVQLAGYPSVIGALWQVGDAHSSDVETSVYKWMLNSNVFDTQKAAEGLHRAVRFLRDGARTVPGFAIRAPSDPLTWAPYIHLGV